MDLGLDSKFAIVCAASSGLGLAIAKNFAKEGTNLVICSRRPDKINEVAAMIREEYGTKCVPVACDLSQDSGRQALIETSEREFPRIDILINNIGGPPPSTARDTSESAWRTGFEQIFISSTILTQHFLKSMATNKFGRIITITSISVTEPIANLTVSTAMRAAVTGFHKTLATEVAKDGITVNTLMPGVIHTDRIEYLRSKKAEREGSTTDIEMQKTAASIPMGRLGQPSELADVCTFLASERSSYLTGQNILVDGGLSKGLM